MEMETGENKWGAYDGRKNSNGSHCGWGTEKDEATINRNEISDAFVFLIPRTAENTHSTFLHFYSGCCCCCCWFCLLFPPQTESINFPFFPFRNDSRCIFYSGFLLFVFISSVSSHFSFFFVDGRSFWNFKFQIIRVRANILNHILNIVFRVLCIFCCCVLIVNILFNF